MVLIGYLIAYQGIWYGTYYIIWNCKNEPQCGLCTISAKKYLPPIVPLKLLWYYTPWENSLQVNSSYLYGDIHKYCSTAMMAWMNGWSLTLDNEVDVCSAWLGSCLKAARVRPLVSHGHPLDLDGEIALVIVGHRHPWVQRPLLVPCEQDVGAVQPGLVGHFLIDLTPIKRWMRENRQ